MMGRFAPQPSVPVLPPPLQKKVRSAIFFHEVSTESLRRLAGQRSLPAPIQAPPLNARAMNL